MRKLPTLFLLLVILACTNNPRRQNEIRKVKIGQMRQSRQSSSASNSYAHSTSEKSRNTVIRMRKSDGVFYVPIVINGISMEFIFDTGASSICLSDIEAKFLLRQGKLNKSDILGVSNYLIADGSTVESIEINLSEVSIGNRTLYNVRASVITGQRAPLLLGQSFLSRFGEISINYPNQTLTFMD